MNTWIRRIVRRKFWQSTLNKPWLVLWNDAGRKRIHLFPFLHFVMKISQKKPSWLIITERQHATSSFYFLRLNVRGFPQSLEVLFLSDAAPRLMKTFITRCFSLQIQTLMLARSASRHALEERFSTMSSSKFQEMEHRMKHRADCEKHRANVNALKEQVPVIS